MGARLVTASAVVVEGQRSDTGHVASGAILDGHYSGLKRKVELSLVAWSGNQVRERRDLCVRQGTTLNWPPHWETGRDESIAWPKAMMVLSHSAVPSAVSTSSPPKMVDNYRLGTMMHW